MENKTTVDWKLRAIMADRQISCEKLAKLSGFSINTVRAYRKANEQPKISGAEIGRLCDAVNCTHLELIGVG